MLVIEKCSYKVRESVAKNEKIDNITKKKEVLKELVDGTISHVLFLKEWYGLMPKIVPK